MTSEEILDYFNTIIEEYDFPSLYEFALFIGRTKRSLMDILSQKSVITVPTFEAIVKVDTNEERKKKMTLVLEEFKRSKRRVYEKSLITKEHPEHIYYVMYTLEAVRLSGLSKKKFSERIHYVKEHFYGVLGGNIAFTDRFIRQIEKNCPITFQEYKAKLESFNFDYWIKLFEHKPEGLLENLGSYFNLVESKSEL